jgi:O-acetylserine/cysteine efflux transporter
MPLTHALAALSVVAIWGTNFVVVARALGELPPLTFVTLRFLFACLPWVLLLPRPRMPLWRLASFGILIGVGQFGLLFYGMNGHISPGVASVVLQSQAPFTIVLAALVRRQAVPARQLLALSVAFAGVGLIAWMAAHDARAAVSVGGVALVVGAAASWAGANVIVMSAGRIDVLAFLTWSSGFAVLPLAALAIVLDPPGALRHVWHDATAGAWFAVAWQVFANTLFGYGVWNWLLARHAAITVTPFALLVPVFGLSASALVLGEPLPPWKLSAAALILGGVGLNLWWSYRPPGRREPMPDPATARDLA